MSQVVLEAVTSDVYKAINARFLDLTPQIELKSYFLDDPFSWQIKVRKNTLDGMDFVVKDVDAFLKCLDAAKIGTEKAFMKGGVSPSDFKEHWAHNASLMASKGIGYREPWRFVLTDHALRVADAQPSLLNAPQMDQQFSGYFAEALKVNLKALHIAVILGSNPKDNLCKVHIDEVGIEMLDENGNVSLTPNIGFHTASELILKSIIPVPEWVKTNVDLHFLSADMGYRRIGASIHLYKTPKLKITLSASCGLTSCDNVDWRGFLSLDKLRTLDLWKQINPTLNISGRHDLLGGNRSRRRRSRR